jgi:uncharacterized protein DUF6815
MDRHSPKVALVSRGDAKARARGEFGKLEPLANALRAVGLRPEPCVYDESFEDEVRGQLMGCDAAVVFVNPIQDGARRDRLDALLEEAAAAGVLVSARPDVIRKLGVKAVLWRTRELGWSGDARFYETPQALVAKFPESVAGGTRVLKQNRGNGGIGVWKVSQAGGGLVEVQEAAGGEGPCKAAMADFLAARQGEFEGAGGYVDQAFQPRLMEGMIRCYMTGDRLAGFGHQLVRALAPPEAGPSEPRIYTGPEDPRFQGMRAKMEQAWTPALCRILDIDPADLPAIWDADFLFGPREPDGSDTFVLCEINASSVYPMPVEAPRAIAATVAARLRARTDRRPRSATPMSAGQ